MSSYRLLRVISTFLAAALTYGVVWGENISFRHLTIDDGLSQNAVTAILQDHRGFMWLGTKDGLNRYDGYVFTTYRHNPFDTASLSASHITSLFEDSRGSLWIGTVEGRVDRFVRRTETFQRFRTNVASEISTIAEDSSGNIWVGTHSDGLLMLAKESHEFVHLKNQPGRARSLSSNAVHALLVDVSGTVWVGTKNRLNKLVGGDAFEHFLIYTKNPLAPPSDNDSSITAILQGEHGTLWLGVGNGVVHFDPAVKKFVGYPHHYDVYRYDWGRVKGMAQGGDRELWIATASELMRFNQEKKTYEYSRNDPLDPKSLSYNVVSTIRKDRTGILWIGTAGGGVNLYDDKSRRFSTLIRKQDPASRIAGFSVRSILEDKEGYVWVSTDVVYRWNRHTRELKSFETTSDQPDDFGNTTAGSMVQSTSGILWFSSTQGLFSYDPISQRTRLYKHTREDTTGLPEKSVHALFEDRSGTLWVATESYLCKLLDTEKGKFRRVRFRQNTGQSQNVGLVIRQDGAGRIWLGTENGLLRFSQTDETFEEFRNDPARLTSLSNNQIKCICIDPQSPEKILWIGTAGGGFSRFDLETRTFHHFGEKDGLPNNVVYGIVPDEQGHLWLSTNKGLSRFDLKTHAFRNYDVGDGLQSNEFNTGAYFRSRSGEIFFGGIKGLNYFRPETLRENSFLPHVVFTGLKLDNVEVSRTYPNSILASSISETKSLTLSPNISIVTFEFAAMEFTAPEKNRYQYKLENFNSDWIDAGTVRSATYTNVPPGSYTFRVKASNNDGIWNDEGAALELTILPPWWKTWWAYALYAIVVLAALYIMRRYELNRLRLKGALELETIEAVKLKELDRLKSRFFANISHEFRTPLTLILGQVDNVMNSGIEVKEKAKLHVALRNARRLLQLINQLLDLSRIEAGSMELKAERHNLVSFVKNVVYSFEALAEQRQISLTFNSDSAQITAMFEPDKMEKIFSNLLSNAFKFTPKGGGVSVIVETSGAGFVQVTVRDTGIGIPADQVQHIFDRFYQVDSASSFRPDGQEGSGIGLALAKELVELHGGSIAVSSKQGVGTEFVVILPFARGSVNEEELRNERAGETEMEERIGELKERNGEAEKRRTGRVPDSPILPLADSTSAEETNAQLILVVEDNADVRAYICEQLEDRYNVIEAADGDEGVTKAQEAIPDLIITDLMMPRMDGYQFTKQIRLDEKTSHIPIVMLTAKADLDDKIEGLERGVDVYLTKPFSAKELKVQVHALISRREELRRRFSTATIIKPSEITATSIDKAFLQKVIACVETHFEDEQFSVEQLARSQNMSISQLNRKLNALINQAGGELIRSMRLERAADLLKQNAGSVAEISYKLGFTDQAYFSRAFKKQFGCTPSQYRDAQS
ncbi:MAG: response regulator [Ignavibacteriae bacterium]|nr:response regulator [Ignavibacteriota bacterium]